MADLGATTYVRLKGGADGWSVVQWRERGGHFKLYHDRAAAEVAALGIASTHGVEIVRDGDSQ